MINFQNFLFMGGYAKFVWLSYALVFLILSCQLLWAKKKFQSLRTKIINEKE